jgi:MFS family permease
MYIQARSRSIFYGWLVAAACFVTTATLGEALFSFGLFFKPLESEFGWSRSLISSGYTAFIIGYAISAAVSGRLADRYRPRFILLSSAALAGIGISLCSQLNSVAQFRLFLLVAGLGSGATFSVPTSVIQRWFRNRRGSGTVLALVLSGTGVGQIVFTPLINYFILTYGWRQAYLIAGLLFWGLIALSSLVIKQSPLEISEPYRSKSPKSVSTDGWRTGKALTTLSYAGIIYTACALVVAIQIVTVHLVPHATDQGMSSSAAAAALGLLGGLSIPGRATSGFIAEKIGWQKAFALSTFGIAASLTWLLFSNKAWMLYVFIILFGIFYGMRAVAQYGVLSEFFGLRSVGELAGITSSISNLVGATAPYMAGFIFDTTGSYFVAFTIMAMLVFTGALVITLVKKPIVKPG